MIRRKLFAILSFMLCLLIFILLPASAQENPKFDLDPSQALIKSTLDQRPQLRKLIDVASNLLAKAREMRWEAAKQEVNISDIASRLQDLEERVASLTDLDSTFEESLDSSQANQLQDEQDSIKASQKGLKMSFKQMDKDLQRVEPRNDVLLHDARDIEHIAADWYIGYRRIAVEMNLVPIIE